MPRLEGWDRDRRERRARELLELVGLPVDDVATRWPRSSPGDSSSVSASRVRSRSARRCCSWTNRSARSTPSPARTAATGPAYPARPAADDPARHARHRRSRSCLRTRIGVLDAGMLVVCDTPETMWSSERSARAPVARRGAVRCRITDDAPLCILVSPRCELIALLRAAPDAGGGFDGRWRSSSACPPG